MRGLLQTMCYRTARLILADNTRSLSTRPLTSNPHIVSTEGYSVASLPVTPSSRSAYEQARLRSLLLGVAAERRGGPARGAASEPRKIPLWGGVSAEPTGWFPKQVQRRSQNSPLGRGVGGADGVVPQAGAASEPRKIPLWGGVSAEPTGWSSKRVQKRDDPCVDVRFQSPPAAASPQGDLPPNTPTAPRFVAGVPPSAGSTTQLPPPPRVSSTFGSKTPKQTGR